MEAGTHFLPLITDKNPKLDAPEKVRKVVLCSGQVYYDLYNAAVKENRNDIAIVRVEQVCPFPFKEIMAEFSKYKNATVTWAQEEPKNAGSWTYVEPRLRNIRELMKKNDEADYAGRPIMAASAVGYTKYHNNQLAKLISDALS